MRIPIRQCYFVRTFLALLLIFIFWKTQVTVLEKYRYKSGNVFNVSQALLDAIGFPLDTHRMRSLIHQDEFAKFVFVTAASKNHRMESLDAVGTIQRHFNNTIYYYDLDENTPNDVIYKLRRMCNVIYRKFNYSGYPSHVRQLTTYAFKPLVVHELLKEHSTILWLDASVRFDTSNLTAVFRQAIDSDGMIALNFPAVSIYSATHRQMYKYLPINRTAAIKVDMIGATVFFMHCSKQVYQSIIQWWVLCSLDVNCIAPTKNRSCTFGNDRHSRYANCHRYDQSSLSILLANHYGDPLRYSYKGRVLTVQRGSSGKHQLLICSEATAVPAATATNLQ